MQTVDILFSNTKTSEKKITFKNISDFIQWFYINNMPNINVESNIEYISESEIKKMSEFLKFTNQIKEQIKKSTDEYNKKIMQDNNFELQEALNELIRVNSGGKALRASLIALGYFPKHFSDTNYIPLATAFELFQTSILIHDDIIDNADMRRGKETIPTAYNQKYRYPIKNSKDFEQKKNNFSNSMGLCLGDLGFYLANEIITTAYKDNPNLGKILSYYNQVIIKTCKGEMLDIILPFKEEYFEKDINLEEKILKIYQLKTAWYSVIGPYCLGLILREEKDENIKEMETLLLDLGVAFQIKDDLLGIYGNEKNIGKPTNTDIEEYKQTILYSYTMTTKYKNELLKYYGKTMDNQKIDAVKTIFIKAGAKKYAENKMNELFENVERKLAKISFISEEQRNLLEGFIVYLKNREK